MRKLFLTIRITLSLLIFQMGTTAFSQTPTAAPLRLAVSGLVHGHVPWILGRKDKGDVQLVGIYEPDTALAHRYAKRYSLKPELFYTNLNKMLDAVKPEAVAGFGTVYSHQATVEACAPRGIHVMVEKPLATSNAQALRMAELARKNKIFLITNFETSWYPTTTKTYQLVIDSNAIGQIKKAVFHHGHEGPKEIGVGKEFFDWLSDPIQNGGGALIDFGCYGANIMTWLMGDEAPVSVIAVTQHFKPDIYPKVEDEATIIVTYPSAQCIIQASWNWPFGRKDMEVYGKTGYVITSDNEKMRIRTKGEAADRNMKVNTNDTPVYTDPFTYFADVIHGKIKMAPNSLYSLENNLKVVQILDAARESAKRGKAVRIVKGGEKRE